MRNFSTARILKATKANLQFHDKNIHVMGNKTARMRLRYFSLLSASLKKRKRKYEVNVMTNKVAALLTSVTMASKPKVATRILNE
ncbi:hypothetical protein EV213_11451 [Aureibacillus halotolerans]|uniref:Uncharacterized protein n=1 Tax=Aureibacillus halotolerans TaxID=1508390 RepID=A0A4R6TWP9_9BACI|nr:hypothetical protein EV213_11451 [Aureibacillus halotolerans]